MNHLKRSEPSQASLTERLRETVLFFIFAFAITWGLQLPAVLAKQGLLPGGVERYLPLMMLGVFGPTTAAWILTHQQRGKPGVRDLFQSLIRSRPGVVWFALALLLPGLALTIPLGLARIAGEELPLFYPPRAVGLVVVALLVSLGEEVGWRGYALPRLTETCGRLLGSVILGAVWAIWHIPMFLGVDVPLHAFPWMLIYFIAGSIVFSWLYFRTDCSLLIAVLAHVGAHLNNSHQALPQDSTPLMLQTIGLCVMAAGVLLGDRRLWRSQCGIMK